jgi:hypothetical protein
MRARKSIGLRVCCALLTLGWYALSDIAAAQSATATKATPEAYAAAMKCFVANGHAEGMKQRSGDAAAAARYEAGSRASFDAALKLGQTLGYTNRRMNQDFEMVQVRELPPMVTDTDYFRRAVATCRTLGLMPAS